MEDVTLDAVDRGLVHALQIDGRAPFSRIGEALGVSENTVARRYRRLRSSGVLRVVGTVNGRRLGYTSWTIRLRCTPDAAGSIADALAARDDTSFVYLLSGGTEISCNTQTRSVDERDVLLLDKLPRTRRVIGVSAHLLLRSYALPGTWLGPATLPPDRAALLHPHPPEAGGEAIEVGPADRALFGALARDGRAAHTDLARATGWSDSTVRRRTETLRRAGVLGFQVDIEPRRLGFHAEARLWMSVRPSALSDVAAAMAAHPEISFVALTTGPTNLVAAVNCRDTEDLARYLTERVATLEAIAALETAPVIRTVKRAGPLLPH
ncbi:Lrp/AsnC family transcriptional regulator [Actinomadura rubrisoli]|uniref:Lrp/AsnC family transcriptional regulator n=1 Tax=Actinomadura rubrisoli TaxID=2530368 RepID=A0A4R4ZXC1_9ACTN|nr:Lrp/AsnC family transcriptional regulator [Actinomadura rubrisoli]TDD63595.1 Lrp/AsnC family transcriptional regulator [Actinomadura rubrisoli]